MSSRVEATLAGIRLAILFFLLFFFLIKEWTKQTILLIKYCYLHSCVALLCNPTVKSEPDKLLIISQVLQRQQYCYGNTFPKQFLNAFRFISSLSKRTANPCCCFFFKVVKAQKNIIHQINFLSSPFSSRHAKRRVTSSSITMIFSTNVNKSAQFSLNCDSVFRTMR